MNDNGVRKAYTQSFREAAVREVIDAGRSVSAVARALNMPAKTLAGWVRRARRGEVNDADSPERPVDAQCPEPSMPDEYPAFEPMLAADSDQNRASSEADAEPTPVMARGTVSPVPLAVQPRTDALEGAGSALPIASAGRASDLHGESSWSLRPGLAPFCVAYAGIAFVIFAITELWFQVVEDASFSQLVLESVAPVWQGWPTAQPIGDVRNSEPASEVSVSAAAPSRAAREDSIITPAVVPAVGRTTPYADAEPVRAATTLPPVVSGAVSHEHAAEDRKRREREKTRFRERTKSATRGVPDRQDAGALVETEALRTVPQGEPKSDWLGALRRDIGRCGEYSLLQRTFCAERARWRHCAPGRWGLAPECPRTVEGHG